MPKYFKRAVVTQQGGRAGDGDFWDSRIFGIPDTVNRMPKRAVARGLNAAKGNKIFVGVWALFRFVERSVMGRGRMTTTQQIPKATSNNKIKHLLGR